jgi:hypothetical protein
MRILLTGLVAFLLVFSSCKKCYVCTKQNTITVNGVDTVQSYKFDACNSGKEGNGTLNSVALREYEDNGYTCTAK